MDGKFFPIGKISLDKIDFQCHVYPREYLKTIEHSDAEIVIERDEKTGLLYFYDRLVQERINPLFEKFYNMELRLKDLDEYGITLQVLTIPVPGVDRFRPDLAVKLSKLANDGIADFANKYPQRATGLACLPLIDIPSALEEFDRAINDLGLKGIGIFSNVRGKFIDAEEFFPIYERAQKYDVPIYVHPNVPVVSSALGKEYNLNLILAWPFDTTIAMTRLALGGVLERFPNLKMVFAHGGGMISLLNARIDSIAVEPFLGAREMPSKMPSEYLRNVYVDSAVNYAPGLMCCASFFGIKHVVLATDYPFGGEQGRVSLRDSANTIDSLPLSEEEKEDICDGNAKRILKI